MEDQNKNKLEEVDRDVKTKIVELMKKGQSFKLPQENYEEVQTSFDLIKISELSNSILAFVGFACAAIISDIEYTITLDHSISRDLLFFICTISTMILILSIIWRTHCTLQWERSRALFSEFDTIKSSNKLKILFLEILLNIIHPLWPLEDLEFSTFNTVYSTEINYAYNDILTVCTICRIYHLVRLYSVFSKYRSERAYRICSINGKFSGTSWAVKCLMNDNPLRVVVVMMVVGVLVGGYCLRIFERPLRNYSDLDFSDYGNAVWCVILTMTTVGYGDYFPTSLPGRIIGLIVCVWGVLMVSIMVYSVTNMLELTTYEERALSLHMKLEFREELKIKAGSMLVNSYRYKHYSRKFPEDKIKISIYLGRFQRALKEFQRFRLKKKILYNLNSNEDNIDRKIDYIDTLARRYNVNYKRLKSNMEELLIN